MYAGAEFGPVRPQTTKEDIIHLSRKLQFQNEGLESGGGDGIDSRHIGSRFNEWRKPVTDFGSNDPAWEVAIKSSPDLNSMDFERKEWARSRDTVDGILDMLLQDIKAYSLEFPGLKIERYVRQGSSRDGLKVIAADEFDTLLLYHFEGFSFDDVQVSKDGKVIPEFCRLEASRQLSWLQTNFPKLYRAGVFKEDVGRKVKLNAKALHQGVFASMIDRSVRNITENIQQVLATGSGEVPFTIRRKMNPPSINITIDLGPDAHQHFMPTGILRKGMTVRQIDVDIVPGIRIRNDQVPDPSSTFQSMDCPVYAVFKWQEESSVVQGVFERNPEVIWRICSSGYEKHTLDLARCNQRLRYVITALRLLKTYFSTTKARAKEANQAPPPITTVLRSYHLKHIAFYLILYLGYLHPDAKVSGVKDVFHYFIGLLNISLEKRRLPHFFHSNKWITALYPSYPVNSTQLRFNLFGKKSEDALRQAKLSFDNHLMPAIHFSYGGSDSYKLKQVKGEYNTAVSYGEFF